MRALRYRGRHDLRLEDVTPAQLGPGDIRLAVESAGVCGTDVRIAKGEHGAYADADGRIPGHEIVGRVVEVGPGAALAPGEGLVSSSRPTSAVASAPNVGRATRICARGRRVSASPSTGRSPSRSSFPRAVERGNLIALANVSPDAAVLIEPLACVLRGQGKVDVHRGDTVLICGGGPVGLLHVALARARGADLVVCSEPSPTRRAAARRAGAVVVVDSTHDDLASALLTAAPVHALQAQALELAAVAGRVLFFGGLPKSQPMVELDTNLIHYKELLVAGTTASTLGDCREAATLVAEGRIELESLVSHRYGLEEAAAAIASAEDRTALKVVIKPSTRRKASS